MCILQQAFPEAPAFVLCVRQHAELSICMACHHLAHTPQSAARDPACSAPQATWTPRSTGNAELLLYRSTLHFCLRSTFALVNQRFCFLIAILCAF